MKTILTVAIIAALVAAAAWALASSKPAGSPYTVEVRDVAGEPILIVVPEVAVTASGHLVMPEVVVHATAEPEVAGLPASGFEVLN
jgi:hypothetical protein